MNKEDGGQAFPRRGGFVQTEPGKYSESQDENGMTLLDYFAAKAMQGMLSADGHPGGVANEKSYAEISYRIADAMIEARKK